MVVHLRDPRQAMLSNLHHIAGTFEETVRIMRSPPPAEYPAWSVAERADWLLKSYFPELLAWVEGWLAAERDPGNGIEILFTTYEDFHADQGTVFDQIIAFHGLARSDLTAANEVEKNRATHFRRGTTDEWRETFTPAQQAAMWARMPRGLSERFSWRP
ncbi:MAG: sulfotransferase domain-containing protein [Alphaproteobacteria bacterium]|nr:sulfotransferase domain-containing protein [Alphaproteobacteria bacterium]